MLSPPELRTALPPLASIPQPQTPRRRLVEPSPGCHAFPGALRVFENIAEKVSLSGDRLPHFCGTFIGALEGFLGCRNGGSPHSLRGEQRTAALLLQATDPGTGEGRRWAKMRTHRILTNKLAEFGASSKLNAALPFLQMHKIEGRTTAEDFLKSHGSDVVKRSTADNDVLLAEC
jgi:hypothetical protein